MIKIIPASPETDFHAVAQLYYETWQVAYRGLVPQGYLDAISPETWHPEKRQNAMFLALLNNQIIGVCSFGPARYPEYRGLGEVYSLYVHPSMQHHGTGRALLQSALRQLDTRYRDCYLVTLAQDFTAIKLYKSEGFQLTTDKRTAATPFGPLHEIVLGRGHYFTQVAR